MPVAQGVSSNAFEKRVRKKINEERIQPFKDREWVKYDTGHCDNCDEKVTWMRESGVWMDGSTPWWYDRLYCGKCGLILRKRSGKYDYQTGELDDIDDLRWEVVSTK